MSVELEIKFNNAGCNDPCAVCEARTDPIVGPEAFLAGTWALVCRACSHREAPDLDRELTLQQQRHVAEELDRETLRVLST